MVNGRWPGEGDSAPGWPPGHPSGSLRLPATNQVEGRPLAQVQERDFPPVQGQRPPMAVGAIPAVLEDIVAAQHQTATIVATWPQPFHRHGVVQQLQALRVAGPASGGQGDLTGLDAVHPEPRKGPQQHQGNRFEAAHASPSGWSWLYAVYFVLRPWQRSTGYLRSFLASLASVARPRSMPEASARSSRYMSTSAISSARASRPAGCPGSASMAESGCHWMSSSSSPASRLRDTIRLRRVWNWRQSRASRKAHTRRVSSARSFMGWHYPLSRASCPRHAAPNAALRRPPPRPRVAPLRHPLQHSSPLPSGGRPARPPAGLGQRPG